MRTTIKALGLNALILTWMVFAATTGQKTEVEEKSSGEGASITRHGDPHRQDNRIPICQRCFGHEIANDAVDSDDEDPNCIGISFISTHKPTDTEIIMSLNVKVPTQIQQFSGCDICLQQMKVPAEVEVAGGVGKEVERFDGDDNCEMRKCTYQVKLCELTSLDQPGNKLQDCVNEQPVVSTMTATGVVQLQLNAQLPCTTCHLQVLLVKDGVVKATGCSIALLDSDSLSIKPSENPDTEIRPHLDDSDGPGPRPVLQLAQEKEFYSDGSGVPGFDKDAPFLYTILNGTFVRVVKRNANPEEAGSDADSGKDADGPQAPNDTPEAKESQPDTDSASDGDNGNKSAASKSEGEESQLQSGMSATNKSVAIVAEAAEKDGDVMPLADAEGVAPGGQLENPGNGSDAEDSANSTSASLDEPPVSDVVIEQAVPQINAAHPPMPDSRAKIFNIATPREDGDHRDAENVAPTPYPGFPDHGHPIPYPDEEMYNEFMEFPFISPLETFPPFYDDIKDMKASAAAEQMPTTQKIPILSVNLERNQEEDFELPRRPNDAMNPGAVHIGKGDVGRNGAPSLRCFCSPTHILLLWAGLWVAWLNLGCGN